MLYKMIGLKYSMSGVVFSSLKKPDDCCFNLLVGFSWLQHMILLQPIGWRCAVHHERNVHEEHHICGANKQ